MTKRVRYLRRGPGMCCQRLRARTDIYSFLTYRWQIKKLLFIVQGSFRRWPRMIVTVTTTDMLHIYTAFLECPCNMFLRKSHFTLCIDNNNNINKIRKNTLQYLSRNYFFLDAFLCSVSRSTVKREEFLIIGEATARCNFRNPLHVGEP